MAKATTQYDELREDFIKKYNILEELNEGIAINDFQCFKEEVEADSCYKFYGPKDIMGFLFLINNAIENERIEYQLDDQVDYGTRGLCSLVGDRI